MLLIDCNIWLLSFNKIIIIKNRIDYRGVIGIWVMVVGYVMKVRLGFVLKEKYKFWLKINIICIIKGDMYMI